MCILLVEDEFLIRQMLQTALEDAGYEVLPAEHGTEAYQHLASHPGRFTCLVTDYKMPGEVTGAHVIQFMRVSYPVIPMILASAYADPVDGEWQDEHKVDVLTKPFDPDTLVRLINRRLH